MCYLVAKKFDDIGCLALQTSHGQYLADFEEKLVKAVGYDRIQLVTISRPSAYGEYEPYPSRIIFWKLNRNLKRR